MNDTKNHLKNITNLYIEADPAVQFINTEDDILRVIENSFSTRKLLIYQKNLDPDFFDLSSGLAGAILQKIAQYQIKTAFIIDINSVESDNFKALARESKLNDEYNFFEDKDAAIEWLLNE